MTGRPAVRAVVFDVGGVLLDWDPRHLYRDLIDDRDLMEWFLSEVCSPAWNNAQDAGRTWAEAVAALSDRFGEYADLIRAYDEQWERMVAGPIAGTVAILEQLRAAGVPTYALTNFSAEKWPVATKAYPFLRGFDGAVVSGEERVMKPEPAIYRTLLDRYGLDPATSFYIDDKPENAEGACHLGMQATVFTDPDTLRDTLRAAGTPGLS